MTDSFATLLLTKRLVLLPLSETLIEAILESPSSSETSLSYQGQLIHVPADSFPLEQRHLCEVLKQRLVNHPEFAPWNRLFLHQETRVVIGLGGFPKWSDAGGQIEIGYRIHANFRRQGYGVEAVEALIAWGFRQPKVRTIIARVDPENLPSKRLLEKLGFQQVPSVGSELLWERSKTDQEGSLPS
ncbi:Hypothetical protein PBC10988_40170 [Planctomycetales bacterium 10988]|nr:Hypothetical protein PBC10988_40170 [Planctomycetales bacterium 10988]